MSQPILTTKLWPPTVRPNLVDRPHLMGRLHDGLDRKLTLISAPAGFGKTTLLAEWIQHYESEIGPDESQLHPASFSITHFCWLSLDEQDNDLTLFLRYLIAALQTADEELGETAVALLQSADSPSPHTVLAILINELAARSDRLIVLLDDYHVIENEAIHDSLAYLLDRQPPQLGLIIASRADPPLPLSRLRAGREMNELRAADLRFTAVEAATFLQQIWGLNLVPEDVAALEARTEGWIAGLQLAALAMQPLADNAARADFIANFTGSHRYVLDYLIEEALHKQPPQIQDFLLRTAILDRLCAPLCQAVLETDDAQTTLEQLEAANLFLTPLDDRRQWYRFHRLFADLLRHRLKQTYPDQIAVLHRRASQWCAQQELTGDAIRHALAAGDLARAGELVKAARWKLRTEGEVATLRRWLDLLPPELVDSSGPLAMGRAWTLMYAGKMAETEAYFARVLPSLLAQEPNGRDWHVELAALQGQIALNHGRFADALTYCLQARAELPDDQLRFRGTLEIMLGHAYRMQDRLDAATAAYRNAAAIAAEVDNRFSLLSALAAQAELAELRGQLHQASAIWQQAQHLAYGRHNRPLPVASIPKVGLGRLYYERNQLDEAAAYLEEAVQLARQAGLGPTVLNGAMALSQLRQAQGAPDEAHAVLRLAAAVMQPTQMALLDLRLGAATARLWLRQRRLEQAAAWAARLMANYGLESATAPGDWFEFEYTLLARIWLAQGKTDEANDLLAQLLCGAEAAGRAGKVIEILTIQALAQQAQGDSETAQKTLCRALTLAEPEGYLRLFVDEGRPLGELLARVVLADTAVSAYAAQLLTAFEAKPIPGHSPPEATTGPEPAATPPEITPDLAHWLAEPLSERELEALRLAAEGLTNRQIGERLFIATATVKKHMENIYGKLYVQNRTQAVARGRELGLL